MESILQKHPGHQRRLLRQRCDGDGRVSGPRQRRQGGQGEGVRFRWGERRGEVDRRKEDRGDRNAVSKSDGAKAAEYADEYLKGNRDFQQKIPVKVELVTTENVNKYGEYGKK